MLRELRVSERREEKRGERLKKAARSSQAGRGGRELGLESRKGEQGEGMEGEE